MLDVVPAEGDVLFGVVVFVVADMVRSYSWDAPTVKQRLQLSRIHSWDAPDGALQYGRFGAGHAANSLHSALG